MRNAKKTFRMPGPAAAGFTLTEILVVIAIITILVGAIVGISAYVFEQARRKQTETAQKLLLSAIDAYYDASSPKQYPPNTDSGVAAANTGEALVRYLTGRHNNNVSFPDAPPVVAATKVLQDMPQKAFNPAGTGGFNVLDGWGNAMRYDPNGGFGGRPLVTSNGKDGDPNTTNDNISSDGR